MSFGHYFGLLVKQKRDEQGLTQPQLAKRIYGDEDYKSRVSEIEAGKSTRPQNNTVALFVEALGITDDEVVDCRVHGASKGRKRAVRKRQKVDGGDQRNTRGQTKARVASGPDHSALIRRLEDLTAKMIADRDRKDIWRSVRGYYASFQSTLAHLKSQEDGRSIAVRHFADIDRSVDLLRASAGHLRDLGYEQSAAENSLQMISKALVDLFGEGPDQKGIGISIDTNNSDAREDIETAEKLIGDIEPEAIRQAGTLLAGPLWGLIADIEPEPGKYVGFTAIDSRRKDLVEARGNDWIGGIAIELQVWLGQHAKRLPHKVCFRHRAESWCPEMVVIDPPDKRSMMGAAEDEARISDSERPEHEVVIARKFALGRYTVTFEEYDAYCEAVGIDLPKDRGWGRGRMPVINVSWDDAQKYFEWLNAQLGLAPGTYRLPSEAEWEFACRAGTRGPFWTGETITTDQANYDGNYPYGDGAKGEFRERTVAVHEMPNAVNPWGLAHMHGNVWEWCEDHWHDSYAEKDRPDDGRAWSGEGAARMLRGGSWILNGQHCRSASRIRGTSVNRFNEAGFRPTRSL